MSLPTSITLGRQASKAVNAPNMKMFGRPELAMAV